MTYKTMLYRIYRACSTILCATFLVVIASKVLWFAHTRILAYINALQVEYCGTSPYAAGIFTIIGALINDALHLLLTTTYYSLLLIIGSIMGVFMLKKYVSILQQGIKKHVLSYKIYRSLREAYQKILSDYAKTLTPTGVEELRAMVKLNDISDENVATFFEGLTAMSPDPFFNRNSLSYELITALYLDNNRASWAARNIVTTRKALNAIIAAP